MSGVVALPKSSDPGQWSAEEKALVEAAGLVNVDRDGKKTLAPRPVVAAFLQHCQRTGLDPFARQIYCLARSTKGDLKWQTQVSIDGARLVAERSKQYQGQTPVEWTADGREWTEVWLSKEHPAAARVGVYRAGFQAPLYAVATWDSYAQTNYKGEVTSMWQKMGPLMLGKCAEMLALRKAFPQDLSGLYSAEEMAQAETPVAPAPSTPVAAAAPARHAPAQPELEVVEAEVVPSRDWAAEANACTSYDQLKALYEEADRLQELGSPADADETVGQLMRRLRGRLLAKGAAAAPAAPEPAAAAVVARDWVAEARAAESRADLQDLVTEAAEAGVEQGVLVEMATFEDSLPVDADVDWNAAASQSGEVIH